MRQVPLFGTSLQSLNQVSSAQMRLNVFYEIKQDGDASKIVIRGTPGLTLFVSLPTSPIRGFLVTGGYLYVVTGGASYSYFYQVGPTGNYTLLSTFGAGNVQTPCEMAANESQIIIVDGSNGGYIYALQNLTNQISVAISSIQADLAPITAIGNASAATQKGSSNTKQTTANTSTTVAPANTVPKFHNPTNPTHGPIP